MKRAKSGWGNKIVLAVLAVFIFCAVTAVVSAAPICNLTKIEPGDLKTNSTGTFIAVINCSDTNGEINTSRFLMTRTVEGFAHPGLPNFWCIRPPVNDIAECNATIPQILRAYNRGVGGWYDIYGLFTDNFSYGVHDNTSLHVTMTSGTGWAELNYTWKVEPTAFRNSIFLNRKQLETETKNEYDVYKNNPLLVKFWDIEQMRGTDNYTVCTFTNIYYSGSPTEDLNAYYCNSSYRTVSEELPNYGASDATANMTGNVLLMHLDETSGTVVDYSGAGNNGTNYGATRGVTGKFDTAFSFDGNDYVRTSATNAPSLNMYNSGYTTQI